MLRSNSPAHSELLSAGAGRSMVLRTTEGGTMFPASTKGGGTSISFPDVCKTPAPPAPFVPIPYPNSQYQKNLKKASKVDAQAKAGNRKAIKLRNEAISNLKQSMGDEAGTLKGVVSAFTAVQIGYTLHKSGVGKPQSSKGTSTSMGLVHHNPGGSLKD